MLVIISVSTDDMQSDDKFGPYYVKHELQGLSIR